jgi:ketosteroid isomerase-like protein
VANQNVALVRETVDRWNAGYREVRAEEIDPAVELHTSLASTTGEPYRGHEGVRRWMADIDEQFDEWRWQADRFQALDENRVLVVGSTHLRGRASGVEFDQPMAWLSDFRHGKLLRLETFTDLDQARRAAGLAS